MIKQIIFKLKGIKLPYEIKDIWLSSAIPGKDRFMGRVLQLKKYPEYGEIVCLFNYKGQRAYYKTTKVERSEHARSPWADLAYWDNGKRYSFVFDHLEEPISQSIKEKRN